MTQSTGSDSAVGARPVPWCLRCCTQHAGDVRCPGEVLASGVERHAWRIGAVTPSGSAVFGVLLARAGVRWRARIVTYPNVLWVVPGGGTMKFLGRSAEEAEHKAVAFIQAHCARKGWKTRSETPRVESGPVDPEQSSAAADSDEIRAAHRQLHTIPIRYGTDRPSVVSTTGDLSEDGLFVVCAEPLPRGTELKLFISLDGFGLPLRGAVQWTRRRSEDGRPPGMGIRLLQTHPRYIAYVRLRRRQGAEQTVEVDAGDPTDV